MLFRNSLQDTEDNGICLQPTIGAINPVSFIIRSCMYTYMQMHLCACVHRSEVIYLYILHFIFLDYIYLCSCTHMCMQATMNMWRTSCSNQSSPLPHRSCQGLNSGCHGVPLSTKPSYWHVTLLFVTRCITKHRTRWFTVLSCPKASGICLYPMFQVLELHIHVATHDFYIGA